VDREDFFDHFCGSISSMEPVVEDVKDLWMNDEVLLTIRTKFGDIEFSKDIWDTAFIMSKNQDCINKIDSLLEKDVRFQKVEVDFEKYK